MSKNLKIMAFILASIFAFSIFVGCNENPADNGSSTITQSETAGQDKNVAQGDKIPVVSKKPSTSSKASLSESKTASTESKTNSVGISPEDWILDEDDDLEDAGNSSTNSSGIKQNKNPKNLGLVAYHCSSFWCNSAGAELKDKVFGTPYESRLKEFTQVVEANYFNQYFLSTSGTTGNMEQLLVEAALIAKQGGSFWISVEYNSEKETIKQYEQKLREILETIEAAGYRELVNGVHWDEPYWNNYSLKDLQEQMRINYTVFGLRNFPVFGLSEFSEVSPRTNKKGDPMPQVCPEYSKYITDAGYDYYSVDVRDGANNGGAYKQYSELLGVPISSGKDIYLAYTAKLKRDIGHNFSLWYFPCAYAMPTWAKTTADEDFCMAHLEFMAEELLEEEYPGGIALYTYHTHTQSHGRVALQERIPLKNEDGTYAYYPTQTKWIRYFDMVKKYNQKFSSIRYKYVRLNV